ncbi:holin family protein [Sporomusa sp. KB1]|uniref:phage holin family protein n=1 Tax=Sporomusa sp. KB1 TaxID=943346 RepID=UPI0011AAECA2|nr:phage holin family protein [Sporomusa sp. KB1]TWH49578.1 toxin secretion/phage lysis holin [Sporomusa sp. KB1]
MNEVINFFREILPVKMEMEWGAAVSIVGTVFCYVVGGWDGLIEALVFAIGIDYVSGMLAAYINPDSQLNSQRGFRGICKKIMILLLVVLAHFLDQATHQEVIRTAVIWFFLGNEGLSIIENAAKAGLPIPDSLKNSLEQLNHQKAEVMQK